MNLFNIHNALEQKKERSWDKIIVCVDIHGTILKPNYEGLAHEFYPQATGTLMYLSRREDIELVLYTCSTQKDINKYLELFESFDIHFDYVNKSSVSTSEFACFDDKPYFNVLLDDKAGFEGESDWTKVYSCFKYNQ